MDQILRLSDIYEHYKTHESGKVVDFQTFKKVCHLHNKLLIEKLLQGYKVNLGYRLSYLQIVRTEVTYNKQPGINWQESIKRREQLLSEGKKLYDKKTGEGHKWLIFYTRQEYPFYLWDKTYVKIKNGTVYQFKPTRGKVGAVNKLKTLLKEDDLAYLNFQKV